MCKINIQFSVGYDGMPDKKTCVPFVSQYTNCNDDNLCSGCSQCTCNAEAEWSCKEVKKCDNEGDGDPIVETEDEIFDHALDMLEYTMDQRNIRSIKESKHPNVPTPDMLLNQNTLLESMKTYRMDEIVSSLMRPRRSTAAKTKTARKRSVEKTSHKHSKIDNNHNNTIKFYETVDELNEDTLNNSNVTGTLTANKVETIPKNANTRRSNDAENSSQALQIDFNKQNTFHQISDNKIEATDSDKYDRSHENLKSVLGNYTQNLKDRDLSKIVVNELKIGKEVIGDANAPVTSNITFTPENDTLTAMAFIAGNLLNKLWNMEKDGSGSSIETDAMKHEKVADLLDLFKEPLNLRQETFLKSALEHLSAALDKHKDIKNISICEDIEDAKKVLYETNSTSKEVIPKIESKTSCKSNKTTLDVGQQKMATVKAISKINNVLELIKKFENIQGSLNDLKRGPKLDFNVNHTKLRINHENDAKLTRDEKKSLNVFGNILDKITKLIMPKKNNKKIQSRIKNQNMLASNDILKKKFKKMYNIDLTNMTVNAKDTLILDYLTHVEGNPDCFLNSNNHKIAKAMPSIEGNILLNLSEFFKMKSFSDLIKLLEPEKQVNIRTSSVNTKSVVETTTASGQNKLLLSSKNAKSKQFNSTKEKLKEHLKTIIEDLLELQNAKGGTTKGDIKIVDALPCIYKVLKAGQDDVHKKDEEIEPPKKIADIFHDLKKELKAAQSRRRYGDIMTIRPKSAVVWERLVKNLNDQSDLKSRRSMGNKAPKSYDEIKVKMDRIENGSSSYKHHALLVQVPAVGRLILFKSLEQETRNAIDVIEDIKLSLDNLAKLPAEKFADIEEFIGNLATRLNLSVRVADKFKPDFRKYLVDNISSGHKTSRIKLKKKPILRFSEPRSEEVDEMKVTRNQIVNQLIKNRMQLYIKMKEDSEFDVSNDVNYNIAKKVLYYLDIGNYDLAKELFKVVVTQTQSNIEMYSSTTNDKFFVTSTPRFEEISMRRKASLPKEPLIKFDNPSKVNAEHINWVNQDQLIKQLLNIKNMGM